MKAAIRDYGLIREAQQIRNQQIWELQEEQRVRVELLSRAMQKRAIEKLRLTIGLKLLAVPAVLRNGKSRTSPARSAKRAAIAS